MRWMLIVTGTLLFAGCGEALDPDATLEFQQAQQAFDNAKTPTDYLLAASLYQRLLNRGVQSGAVLYNQGNAYIRGDQRGRAIACYRQAKRYLPRDTRLEANLRYAVGDVATNPKHSLWQTVIFWQDWLSYPEKFQTTAALAVITLALGVTSILLPRTAWRRAAMVVLIVTFVVGSSALYDWYRFEQLHHGVVTKQDAIARKGNAKSYEPALTAPLPEGTEFQVLESRGQWVLVRLPAGQEGWLEASEVVIY